MLVFINYWYVTIPFFNQHWSKRSTSRAKFGWFGNSLPNLVGLVTVYQIWLNWSDQIFSFCPCSCSPVPVTVPVPLPVPVPIPRPHPCPHPCPCPSPFVSVPYQNWSTVESPSKERFGEMALVEKLSLFRRFVFFSLYHPATCLFPIYNELLWGLVMITVSSESAVTVFSSCRSSGLFGGF